MSFEGYNGIIVVASQAAVEALVIGSLREIQFHWTAVVIAEIAIVECSMVCVDCALRGLLPLFGRFLGAVSPRVLYQFVGE